MAKTATMILDNFYVYTRYAAERVGAPGLQGGTIPIKIGPRAALEPYGHLNDLYQADSWFADYYCAALGHAVQAAREPAALLQGASQRRYRRVHARQRTGIRSPNGDNAWVIADSNHGFKMIGVGKLTAQMLVHTVTSLTS